LQAPEIPRLRLGMTIGGLRLGMTIAALRIGMTIAALRIGMTIAALRLGMAKPGRRNDAGLSSRATRGIPALRAPEIPRLRLGMTIGGLRLAMTRAALRLGMAKPGRRNDAGLSSRATRGIPALRAPEIPRLRLGMTKRDGCERQAVGRLTKIRSAQWVVVGGFQSAAACCTSASGTSRPSRSAAARNASRRAPGRRTPSSFSISAISTSTRAK
jgi:hypothetical protein